MINSETTKPGKLIQFKESFCLSAPWTITAPDSLTELFLPKGMTQKPLEQLGTRRKIPSLTSLAFASGFITNCDPGVAWKVFTGGLPSCFGTSSSNNTSTVLNKVSHYLRYLDVVWPAKLIIRPAPPYTLCCCFILPVCRISCKFYHTELCGCHHTQEEGPSDGIEEN